MQKNQKKPFNQKITCVRKKARLHTLVVQESETKRLIYNGRCWNVFKEESPKTSLNISFTEKIICELPVNNYYVKIRGGGTESQVQTLQKVLLNLVSDPQKLKFLKDLQSQLFNYDNRPTLPSRYGGKGARTRSQKSYR